MSTERTIRILQVVRRMAHAGVETWLMHLLRRFDRAEYAIDFLVQTEEPGAYDDEIRSLGSKILTCLTPSQPWMYCARFARHLKESGPYDVVHSHTYFNSGVDLRIAGHAGVPMRIAHIHPYSDLKAGGAMRAVYRRWMAYWIRNYGTHFLAPSHSTIEGFRRLADCGDRPFQVIRNCVDARFFRPPEDPLAVRRSLGIPADRPLIVYVSRFAPHKNHLFLEGLAASLTRLGMPARFLVAGSGGSCYQQVQQRFGSRPDFIILVDPVDIASLLHGSDLFVFPSLEEGFGTVAIEAAAAGLPVVATDLPAIREACPPSMREYMFAPGDCGAAAASIVRILHGSDLPAQKAAAVQFARQFSIEAAAEQLGRLYDISAQMRARRKAVTS